MPLSEAEFTVLVDAGCTQCGSAKLNLEAFVSQRVPLLEGEVFGAPTWAYKGEELVQGTFLIECARCQHRLYTSEVCSRCGADGGVEKALEADNDFALPVACSTCASSQLIALAWVPVRVVYQGSRADKARSTVTPDDPGFHAFRVECKGCHDVTLRQGSCSLCAAPRSR